MNQISLMKFLVVLNLGASILPGLCFASGEDLISAAEDGELEEVVRLLDSGEDVNYSPQGDLADQTSPLTAAIAGEHEGVTRVLLSRGADVNQFGQGNGTPLMHAALNGDAVLVKDLIQKGADVNAQRRGVLTGSSAIHWAVQRGSLDVLRILLQSGAKVSELNDRSDTPLMLAIEAERLDLVRLLLKSGADPEQTQVWSATLREMGTPSSNSLKLLERRRLEERDVSKLEQIVVYLFYKEFARLEVVLEKRGYDEEGSAQLVGGLLNRIGAEFQGGRKPEISSLLHLSLIQLAK